MNILRYDGSFYGLIYVLAPYLKRRQLPDGIDREDARQPSLFSGAYEQPTVEIALRTGNLYDPEVFRLSGITSETWLNAWHAFLSEVRGIEMSIARYLLFALDKNGNVDAHMADSRVRIIQRLARKVTFERHRFMGLLRFRIIGHNLYYASINSDNFLLPILAPFFVERFNDQQWLIHDRKRGLAAIYDLRTWTIIERATADMPVVSPEEDNAQRLWQCFFDSIAVRERLNLALQQKFIPKKYWQDLIETPGHSL